MADSVFLVLDYDKVCRLCLSTKGIMSSIFSDSEEIPIQQQILRVTGFQLSKDDGMPSLICHKCRYITELAYDLQEVVRNTQKLLTEAGDFINHTDKVEVLEPEYLMPQKDNIEKYEQTNKHEKEDMKMLSNDSTQSRKETLRPRKKRKRSESPDYTHSTVSSNSSRTSAPKHLTCQICLATFTTVNEVEEHVSAHYITSNLTSYLHVSKPYSCEECKEMNLTKLQLIQHHRQHLGVNPYVCQHPGCQFVGKDRTSFRQHRTVHSAAQQVCCECGAQYKRRWELRVHVLRAHSATDAPLTCPRCGLLSRNVVALRAHVATHSAVKRFACTWAGCEKRYGCRSQLAAHARSHRAARVFTCQLCRVAAYTSQSLLNRHMRMHERRRLWACDKCAATFADYGAYYSHRVTGHGRWRPLRCQRCHLSYQKPEHLEKHQLTCKQNGGMLPKEPSHQEGDMSPDKLETASNCPTLAEGEQAAILDRQSHGGQFERADLDDLPEDGLLFIKVGEQ